MVLIFGGAYQGKLSYAQDKYNCDDSKIFNCREDSEILDFNKDIINSFHLFVLNQVNIGEDSCKFIEDNLEKFKGKIIIWDDISCGVVPLDKNMREWREALGRSTSLLSRYADEVIRVFCGLGVKIK